MELVSPGIGLMFWMSVSFGIVLLVLRKYAWKPILSAIRSRERSIARSLINAQRIEEEMNKLELIHQQKAIETEEVCNSMIQHATKAAADILDEARKEARVLSHQQYEEAMKLIRAEKEAAIRGLRDEVARISLEMAEKVLEESFTDPENQKEYMKRLLDKMEPN